jgi:hypothetical protein
MRTKRKHLVPQRYTQYVVTFYLSQRIFKLHLAEWKILTYSLIVSTGEITKH